MAHAAQQLADKLQSQLSAVEQINQAAEAITHTEQDNAQRAEQTLLAAQNVRQNSASGQQSSSAPPDNLEQLLELGANGQQREDDDAHIVTIICDRGDRYLSAGVFQSS